MKVGVDARALAASRGVTRYAAELLRALAGEHPGDRWRLFAAGRQPLEAAAGLRGLPNVTLSRHPLPGRALYGTAAIVGRPRLDRLIGGEIEVVWAPTVAPLALSSDMPLALTVQDLSFALRPGDFTAYERLWHRLARPARLARRAAAVIVLAAPTRQLLVDRWGLDPGRVHVVAPGVHRPPPAVDAEPVLARLGVRPGGYLLAVGALEPRKAPELLARAFHRARRSGLELALVFAGEGRLAPRLSGSGVVLAGRVSDAELESLYAGATALAMASQLEGYGLPVREALARGVPAIVSDLPAYGPELSGALLRVPVGDEGALAEAIAQVADPAVAAVLSAAGPPAVAELTWESAARRTRALLAGVARNGAEDRPR